MLKGSSGIPEVPSTGLPSPPSSPPLAAFTAANELALQPKRSIKKRDADGRQKERGGRGAGAAHAIPEQCERLFCGLMKSVFSGEGKAVISGPQGSGACFDDGGDSDGYFAANEDGGRPAQNISVEEWLEIWDYAGGTSFRAFIAGEGEKKSLFVFFDRAVIGRDLKHG